MTLPLCTSKCYWEIYWASIGCFIGMWVCVFESISLLMSRWHLTNVCVKGWTCVVKGFQWLQRLEKCYKNMFHLPFRHLMKRVTKMMLLLLLNRLCMLKISMLNVMQSFEKKTGKKNNAWKSFRQIWAFLFSLSLTFRKRPLASLCLGQSDMKNKISH